MSTANNDIASLREDYRAAQLTEDQVLQNPFAQFRNWLDSAISAQLREPNAMTLATVSAAGQPSARIVLLKGLDERGFCFYTNYQSDKAQQLESQKHAALVFHWIELERQVRVEGMVERVSAEESDAYFHSRPLASRVGAWVSPQSRVITSRAVLEEREKELTRSLGRSPARPEHWGGYRVVPNMVEFWQGRSSRLHDRLRFTRETDQWRIERLAP
jgi:pyridoxamine 5'-phosphate oxidase